MYLNGPREHSRKMLASLQRDIRRLEEKQRILEEQLYTLHDPHHCDRCWEKHSRIEDELQELNEKQLILEQDQVTFQTLLACIKYPILTLPDEITSLIFIHLVADSDRDHAPSPNTAPLLLLQVCRRWQHIALTTPQLWARLELSTLMLPPHYLGKVPRWFERAKALPLSLHLTAHDADDMDDLRTLVSLDASRLESLTAVLPLEAFPLDNTQFPLLECVTLGPLCFRPAVEVYPPYTCFENAPRLREVHLLKPATPALFILPSAQLTKFTGHGFTADQCLDFLRCAPSLVECTLHVELDDPPVDRSTRADLPQLKSFCIERSEYSEEVEHTSAAAILDLLDAPLLERLELVGLPNLHHYADEMVRFFSRVSKSLREFSYISVVGDEEDTEAAYLDPVAANWLDYLPHLTHIAFYNPDQEFMDRFIDKLVETTFLPRLRSLRLIDYTLSVDLVFLMVIFTRSCINLSAVGRDQLEAFDLIWRDVNFAQSLRDEAQLLAPCVKEGRQFFIGVPGVNELAKWIEFPSPVYFHV
ncbi:hypothetical protein FB45DRAFT_428497 [Roridomyces roridus]|uniref:F-box domain-containing protein n=1 Tax=Roridomyces roridus TaxID=1738132 RepID=A0AAD7FRZ6_9AGAR|nr:hypothetical protein FB45DRAFT_428497 [Roridomyces roridus]